MAYYVSRYTDDIFARSQGANAGDLVLVDGATGHRVPGEGPWGSHLKGAAERRCLELNRELSPDDVVEPEEGDEEVPNIFDDLLDEQGEPPQ